MEKTTVNYKITLWLTVLSSLFLVIAQVSGQSILIYIALGLFIIEFMFYDKEVLLPFLLYNLTFSSLLKPNPDTMTLFTLIIFLLFVKLFIKGLAENFICSLRSVFRDKYFKEYLFFRQR